MLDPAVLIAEAEADDEDEVGEHEQGAHAHDSTTSISHAALLKTKPADAAAAEFIFVTTTPSTEDLTLATTVTATSTKRRPKITITKTLLTHRGTSLVTVTTTVLQVTTQDPGAGVCSTFIICNPTQFTCPAQVTNLPAIQAVVQSIMDGQERFGDAGVKSRRLSPNGAILHGEEKAGGVLGDGTDLMGGLAPVNALGFGPGGMFQKALGGDLVPPSTKDGEGEPKVVLMPDGPVTLTPSSAASSSSTAEPPETASSSSTSATVAKALRGQSSSALSLVPSHLPVLVPLLMTICLLLL
jgi:hypothetical protein